MYSVQGSYVARVRLATSLIVLVILASSLSQLRYSLSSARPLPATRYISEYDKRFNDIKGLLPSGRVVLYADNETNLCGPFVMARYALAPAILRTRNQRCGVMDDLDGARAAISTTLRLDNSLGLSSDPYLKSLFPLAQPSRRPDTPEDLFPKEQLALLKDAGHGVRLYSGEAK